MTKDHWYIPKTKWDYFIASGLIVNMIVILTLVIAYSLNN